MKKISCMLLAAMAVVSCSKIDLVSDGDESRVPVQLYGVINDTDATRGDGVIEGDKLSTDLSLDVFRADMDASKTYGSVYTDALSGTMATSGDITMTPKQYYLPDKNRKTKYIAAYPTGGTYNAAARTITYTLDGTQDVMCSSTVEGNKGSSDLTLAFNHLLTKLKVEVKVEGADATEKATVKALWGNVTSIKVKGRKTNVVLTLPAPSAGTGTVGTLAAGTSATADLALRQLDGKDIATAGVEIPDDGSAATFGYAMFLPFSSEKLKLDVTTVEGGKQEVETKNPLIYEAGKGYQITVTFKIDGTTTITAGSGEMGEWDDETTPENIDLT